MMRCEYCDAATNDLKPSASFCYSGSMICPDCRQECERCKEFFIPEEGDFAFSGPICLSCDRALNGPPDGMVWPYEHLTRASDD